MAAPRPLLPQIALAAALLAWGLATAAVPAGPLGSLRRAGENEADLDRKERGYYEHLLGAGRRLDAAAVAPPAPPFKDGPLAMTVDDLRECVLAPGITATHRGARWSTNALGLRDRDHGLEKPGGTVRIALIGDSIGVGWGVDDGNGFEPRLERALDARSRAAGGPGVELLNLCVPGYSPGQRREQLERLGWPLGPDLVLYQGTAADVAWDERRLRALLPAGIGWDAPMYRGAIDSAGVRRGDDPATIKDRLRPRRWQILEDVYRTIVADARSRGVPAAWALLPRVGRTIEPEERDRLVRLARRAGFDPAIDLSGAFDGHDPARLAVGPDDYHPNADGHALLARRLGAALDAEGWPPPLGGPETSGGGDER